MPWRINRPFRPRGLRAMLSECPDRVSVWAFCPTIFTLSRSLSFASVGRRDHLRALAQRIEVADREVHIIGSKGNLLHALTAMQA